MYITIGETSYSILRNLRFDPVADVTGNSVPINEFSAEIITDDEIEAGQYAFLYDDLNQLWAKYWLIFADRTNQRTNPESVSIQAQSMLRLLDRDMLDAEMLTNEPLSNILDNIFQQLGANAYTVDASFAGTTVSGFVPEQTAKNRLQWVCFTIGAYIKSFFSPTIDILPVNNTPTLIPFSKTYMHPNLVNGDYVTRVNVMAYSYEVGTPGTTDAWVTDGTNTYIESDQNHSIGNPDIPAGTLTNEKHFNGIKIVTTDNVDDILSHLSVLYFKRLTVELDVVNNGDFMPGDRIYFYLSSDEMGEGYIEKADFTFGVQAKSRLSIAPVELVDVAYLVVDYVYQDTRLRLVEYTFPVSYQYEVENPYFDETWGQHRYVFYPKTSSIAGTMVAGINESTVQYGLALEMFDGDLNIYSVDDYTVTDGEVTIL